jgi:hypothetical protein
MEYNNPKRKKDGEEAEDRLNKRGVSLQKSFSSRVPE